MRLILLIVLSGCSVIDMHTPPPSDWPKLQERIVYGDVTRKESGCTALGTVACANVNFHTGVCTIYLSTTDEYGILALEHEREHCKGRDHIGSTQLRDYWNWYKKETGK